MCVNVHVLCENVHVLVCVLASMDLWTHLHTKTPRHKNTHKNTQIFCAYIFVHDHTPAKTHGSNTYMNIYFLHIYLCIVTHLCLYGCAYTCRCVTMHKYICTNIFIYVLLPCVFVCIWERLHVQMCDCMRACVCVGWPPIYIHIYIFAYILYIYIFLHTH